MKLGVLDINNKEIESGDTVKFWNIYYWNGSSEEIFGTEPETSFRVTEMYPEQLESELYFMHGAYCVKHGDNYISLKSIVEGNHHCYYYILGSETESEVDEFLDGMEEDKFIDMLRELEIIG